MLSGSDEESPLTETDVKEAYRQIADFLSRQSEFSEVLGTEAQFERIYNQNMQLREVVRQVGVVEQKLERVNAPREQLQRLLNEMFGGHKQIVLSDNEIVIRTNDNASIGLPLLSSGEKQLLLLALEGLMTGNHVLLIDEPELSLHVDWQRRLIGLLTRLNPRMQLIVATHSPEIMADLPDHQIFRIWGD